MIGGWGDCWTEGVWADGSWGAGEEPATVVTPASRRIRVVKQSRDLVAMEPSRTLNAQQTTRRIIV